MGHRESTFEQMPVEENFTPVNFSTNTREFSYVTRYRSHVRKILNLFLHCVRSIELPTLF